MMRREKLLESPFTWEINAGLFNHYDEDMELSVAVEDQPAISIMEILTSICRLALKGDYEKAKQRIVELEELRNSAKITGRLLSENISPDVLDHIVQSTTFYVYELAGNASDAEAIFERISNANTYTECPMRYATIQGCKAIAWSSFHESGQQKAIIYAKKAVQIFADCPLWHFLLYKNYRRARRMNIHGGITKPSEDEIQAIFECTRMSGEPFYFVHQAQMYKERGDLYLAQTVYKLVYKVEPDSTEILLRLANGFIKGWKMEMAKDCLDKVEQKVPKNPMYSQYRGMYLFAVKRYEEAADYFKKATDCTNGMYVTDIQYVASKMKADKNFDHIQYLREMLEKYEDLSGKQNILLHLAMQYRTANELSPSCESFVEAILIDQSSQRLKNFRNRLLFNKKKVHNIFEYVNKFIPECRRSVDLVLLERLQELCQEAQ